MKKLDNKVVFITGGNSGIGQACAFEAAKEGAVVIVGDLPSVDHTDTMNELKSLGAECLFVPLDVTDVESVKSAINTIVEKYGRLDVALNNAGVAGAYSGIHDMEEADWDRVIKTNLTRQFYCIKYELQQFLKQGGGVIVNMASMAGLYAEHGLVSYTASKHGLIGITKNIARQYGDKNIRANALCPYYVDTPLIKSAPPIKKRIWAEKTPAKRLAYPQEIGRAFIYFASDDSAYCNGTHLVIDGGAAC